MEYRRTHNEQQHSQDTSLKTASLQISNSEHCKDTNPKINQAVRNT